MNKNLTIILFLLGSTINCFSQTKVSNIKTEEHISISGTGIYLIPPPEFVKGENFAGLQNNKTNSSIIVNETPAPYELIINAFTKEIKQKGMELLNTEEYLINSAPAVIITTKQFSAPHNIYFIKTTMILRLTPTKTLVAHANTPDRQKEIMGPLMKNSLLSIVNDPSVVTDVLSSLDFKVDLSKTSFKQIRSLTGTIGLKGPAEELIMIAKSIRYLDPKDKKGSSIKALKAISTLQYVSLIDSKEITIDGLTGYQITANVLDKSNSKPSKVVQTILFSNNSYYAFVLIAKPGEQKLVKEFDYIVSTFKRK